jgi:hypothetical protein
LIIRVALGAMTVELENKHGKVDWSCKTLDLSLLFKIPTANDL